LPIVSLKYSADAASMLRPDKLVVHVATLETVELLGSRLLDLLHGCPVQGVPFTAELGGDGLVSFGCDPPPDSDATRIGVSWRMWVTRVLAEGLVASCDPGEVPSERALEAVSRAGVDPLTWAPKPGLWASAKARHVGDHQ
jgi:hypothetical protein